MMNKIFIILITVLILETVHTVPTYGKFKLIKTACERNSSIDNCVFNVLSNSVSDPACSNDYYKSHICFSTFSTCFLTQDNEQMPQVCWSCWTQSPSEKEGLYSFFQKCLIDAYGSYLVPVIVLLLLNMIY